MAPVPLVGLSGVPPFLRSSGEPGAGVAQGVGKGAQSMSPKFAQSAGSQRNPRSGFGCSMLMVPSFPLVVVFTSELVRWCGI
jgi:hypothetical protein